MGYGKKFSLKYIFGFSKIFNWVEADSELHTVDIKGLGWPGFGNAFPPWTGLFSIYFMLLSNSTMQSLVIGMDHCCIFPFLDVMVEKKCISFFSFLEKKMYII